MRSLVVQLNYKVVEDLLADLGYGEITIEDIMNPLREAVKTQPVSKVKEPEPKTLLPCQNLDWDSAPPSSKSLIVGIEGTLGSDSVVVVSHLAYLD